MGVGESHGRSHPALEAAPPAAGDLRRRPAPAAEDDTASTATGPASNPLADGLAPTGRAAEAGEHPELSFQAVASFEAGFEAGLEANHSCFC